MDTTEPFGVDPTFVEIYDDLFLAQGIHDYQIDWLLSNIQGPRILDVGAGTGRVAIEVKKRVADSVVVAIEPDPSFFEVLQLRLLDSAINCRLEQLHHQRMNSVYATFGSLQYGKTKKSVRESFGVVAAMAMKDGVLALEFHASEYWLDEPSPVRGEYVLSGEALELEVRGAVEPSGKVKASSRLRKEGNPRGVMVEEFWPLSLVECENLAKERGLVNIKSERAGSYNRLVAMVPY